MHLQSTTRALVAAILILVVNHPARAEQHQATSAASGLELVRAAAQSWAADAKLVYLENDEDVDATGKAVRWGYLFYSESKGQSRGYTVRDEEILEAADLEFELQDPPPLSKTWIDSDVALAAAEDKAGRKYRQDQGGTLRTMLLIRGAFYHKKPDLSTWTLLYTSQNAPALWVVVSAKDGKVLKTWRG
jgi:hypothetical protein